MYELPAESSLDAEIAAGHVVIERRSYANDLVVLFMHGQGTADAAIRADGVGTGLPGFIPGAGLAHIVFSLEHQRTRRADADAVAAIDAG